MELHSEAIEECKFIKKRIEQATLLEILTLMESHLDHGGADKGQSGVMVSKLTPAQSYALIQLAGVGAIVFFDYQEKTA